MAINRMLRAAALALLPVVMAAAPPPDSFFERYIVGRSAAPCYARAVEGVGRLKRFFLSRAEAPRLLPPSFDVSFGFTISGSPDVYAGRARCEAVGPLARCRDATARFTLAPEGSSVKLQIGSRLTAEGPEGLSPDLADGRDRLVIMLAPSPAEACAVD